MVAKYSVKVGNIWYRAGDILPPSPVEFAKSLPLPPIKKEPGSQTEPEAKPGAKSEEVSKRELVGESEKKPTKQMIIKSSVAELREWVERLNLSGNTVNMNGPQLRALLFRHYKV